VPERTAPEILAAYHQATFGENVPSQLDNFGLETFLPADNPEPTQRPNLVEQTGT